jgi:hypothetical protein
VLVITDEVCSTDEVSDTDEVCSTDEVSDTDEVSCYVDIAKQYTSY